MDSTPSIPMRTGEVLGLDTQAFHRMSYSEWGEPANDRVVICVHGLTRNGRDFDFLAQALAPHFRVICPDVVGRGRSDWLTRKEDYGYPQYLSDMTALMARFTVSSTPSSAASKAPGVHWVGTSMGGMMGMILSGRPNSPIRKLVVNDVGPLIPKAALERIGTYVGQDPRFDTFDKLKAYVREICAPFGPLTDTQWHHVAHHSAREHDDGKWGLSYDPAIAAPFQKSPQNDVDLWASWNAITCPTLVIRGGDSDLLLKDTAEQMKSTGPKARVVEFAGTGHAPMLMSDAQIKVVKDFLLTE